MTPSHKHAIKLITACIIYLIGIWHIPELIAWIGQFSLREILFTISMIALVIFILASWKRIGGKLR